MSEAIQNLSDSELEARISKAQRKVAPPSETTKKADKVPRDPDAFILNAAKDVAKFVFDNPAGQAALKGVGWAAEKIEQYSPLGVPLREGLVTAKKEGIGAGLKAYVEGFGKPSDKAPGRKELGEVMLDVASYVPGPHRILKGATIPIPETKVYGFGKVGPSQIPVASVVGMAPDVVPLGAIGKGAQVVGEAAKGPLLRAAKPLISATDKALHPIKTIQKGVESLQEASDLQRGIHLAGEAIKAQPLSKYFIEQAAPLAKKYGIDPESLSWAVKTGEGSTLDYLSRGHAQNPLAQAERLAHNKVSTQIRDAVDTFVRDDIGKGKELFNAVDAGQALRDGFVNAKDQMFDSLATTYQQASKDFMTANKNVVMHVPDKSLEKLVKELDSIKDDLLGKTRQAPSPKTSQRQQQIAETVRYIDEAKQFLSNNRDYDALVEAMQEVGKVGWAHGKPITGTDIPLDTKAFMRIYHAQKEAALDTVEKGLGKKYRSSLEQANKQMTEFFDSAGNITPILFPDTRSAMAAPERVFERLIGSGNSKYLESVKKLVDADTLGQIKASYIDDMMSVNKLGEFQFGRLRQRLVNTGKGNRVLDTLFDPNEKKELLSLIELGERHGDPILNPSFTASKMQVDKALKEFPAEKQAYEASKVQLQGLKGFVRELKEKKR